MFGVGLAGRGLFDGDSIYAMWNAPTPDPEPVVAAPKAEEPKPRREEPKPAATQSL